MPRPQAGESKNDYIGRCVRQVMGEGSSQDQALGKCYGMWNQAHKAEIAACVLVGQVAKAADPDKVWGGVTVGGPGHEHRYVINAQGDGTASAADGHTHSISGFLVVPEEDHGHALDRTFEGFKVEGEHSDDPLVRLKIALDHLRETPDYYVILEAVGL